MSDADAEQTPSDIASRRLMVSMTVPRVNGQAAIYANPTFTPLNHALPSSLGNNQATPLTVVGVPQYPFRLSSCLRTWIVDPYTVQLGAFASRKRMRVLALCAPSEVGHVGVWNADARSRGIYSGNCESAAFFARFYGGAASVATRLAGALALPLSVSMLRFRASIRFTTAVPPRAEMVALATTVASVH
jgi:hypothetical protein